MTALVLAERPAAGEVCAHCRDLPRPAPDTVPPHLIAAGVILTLALLAAMWATANRERD